MLKSMTNYIHSMFTILLTMFAVGCHSGNVVRFEQRSNAGISSMEIGEYTIPIISISTGPSLSVFQSKDTPCYVNIVGYATTTNTTSALGIYKSTEEKRIFFDGVFKTSSTNEIKYVKTKD